MKIILASNSPRRLALMQLANIDCEVIPSTFDEKVDSSLSLEEQSKELAYQKAKEVFDNTQGERAVVGADTIVIKDDEVFGKPKDRSDAIRMLKALQDDLHEVYTGLCILIESSGEYIEHKEVVKTIISVDPMTDEEIEEYVDLERPFDKAGAYAVQSSFAKYINNMEGNYMSVVGLPIDRVYKILKENDAFIEL